MRILLPLAAGWLLTPLAGVAPLPAAVLRVDRPAPNCASLNDWLLAEGWRFRVGDNPAWARPVFAERGPR
jgi:hypothetical protein